MEPLSSSLAAEQYDKIVKKTSARLAIRGRRCLVISLSFCLTDLQISRFNENPNYKPAIEMSALQANRQICY